MSESRFSPTRLAGWKRTALPAALAALLGTPMLWALGVFDGTADPLNHAAIFGVSFVLLSVIMPWSFGWALQGFVPRKKVEADAHDEHVSDSSNRPGGPSHAARRS